LVGDFPNIGGLQNDDALSSGKGTNQGCLNDEAGLTTSINLTPVDIGTAAGV
jgi:hypothetical protein